MLCPECETRVKNLEKLKPDEGRRERAKKYVEEMVEASKEAAEMEKAEREREQERKKKEEEKEREKLEKEAAANGIDLNAQPEVKKEEVVEVKEEPLDTKKDEQEQEELFPAKPQEVSFLFRFLTTSFSRANPRRFASDPQSSQTSECISFARLDRDGFEPFAIIVFERQSRVSRRSFFPASTDPCRSQRSSTSSNASTTTTTSSTTASRDGNAGKRNGYGNGNGDGNGDAKPSNDSTANVSTFGNVAEPSITSSYENELARTVATVSNDDDAVSAKNDGNATAATATTTVQSWWR